MSPEELIKFEDDIAEVYKIGKIRGPIHLRDGNEQQLIEVFKQVRLDDYVFSTWASHLHALLKGVPKHQVYNKILAGESITLHFPEERFYSSAIVGGIVPIAVGTAESIIRKGWKDDERVWCFVGDMALHNGTVLDSIQWSIKQDLPITFVVEDNGKSVCTITDDTTIPCLDLVASINQWGRNCKNFEIQYYKYISKWPHSGTGAFVSF